VLCRYKKKYGTLQLLAKKEEGISLIKKIRIRKENRRKEESKKVRRFFKIRDNNIGVIIRNKYSDRNVRN